MVCSSGYDAHAHEAAVLEGCDQLQPISVLQSCGPPPPAPGSNVVASGTLLRASEAGDVQEIISALAAGADIEARPSHLQGAECWNSRKTYDSLLHDEQEPMEMVEIKDLSDPPTLPPPPSHEETTMAMQAHVAKQVDPCLPGLTPLMLSARRGHVMAVALLIDAQASPNARESSGMQALHFAAMRGCFQTCDILVNAGASSTAMDKLNRTAFKCLPYEHIVNHEERQAWSSLLLRGDSSSARSRSRGGRQSPMQCQSPQHLVVSTSASAPAASSSAVASVSTAAAMRPQGDVIPASAGGDGREVVVVPL